jgi:hypothetical protein
VSGFEHCRSCHEFDRNTNTGGVIASECETDFIVAENEVLHDAGHPSHRILPVIERP